MPWLKLGVCFQQLGLALMIGGLLALGAFTAPVLFRQFDRDAAGQAMTVIFRRYDWVLLAGAGLVVVGEVVRTTAQPFSTTPTGWARVALTGVLAVLVVSSTFGTNKQLTDLYAQNQQDTPAFQLAHKQSEGLAKGQLLTGVVLLILSVITL
jgi:Domain of unknown function (DUF4149)